MFLLGFYLGRRNMFADLDALGLLRRVFAWGMIVGLPLAFIGARLEGNNMGIPNAADLLETTVKSIGVPILSLGYTAGLCLMFRRSRAIRSAFATSGTNGLDELSAAECRRSDHLLWHWVRALRIGPAPDLPHRRGRTLRAADDPEPGVARNCYGWSGRVAVEDVHLSTDCTALSVMGVGSWELGVATAALRSKSRR